MLKTVGVILVSFVIVSLGFGKGNALKKKTDFLYEMSEFVRFASEQIRFSRSTTETIISAGRRRYKLLGFLDKSTDIGNCFGYKKEVTDFMASLGTCDISGQMSLCEKYRIYFDSEHRKSIEYTSQNSKAYKMLGILGSAAVIILFI